MWVDRVVPQRQQAMRWAIQCGRMFEERFWRKSAITSKPWIGNRKAADQNLSQAKGESATFTIRDNGVKRDYAQARDGSPRRRPCNSDARTS